MAYPRRNFPIMLGVAAVVAVMLWATLEPRADEGPEGVRAQITKAYRDGDNTHAVELGERMLAANQSLDSAGSAMAEALVAEGNYERAAHLLTEGQIKGASPDLLNRAGMGLHCGNTAQIKLAIACLKAALAQQPSSLYYRFNLAVAYWNGGYIPESRKECEAVLAKDPGNVQAFQILQRIQKQDFSSKVSQATSVRRRTAKLLIKGPKDATLMVSGSWNQLGQLDQFAGWQPVPMKKVRESGSMAVFEHDVDLETEKGRWYSCVVTRTSAGKGEGRPVAMARFPVYPLDKAPFEVNLERERLQPPSAFTAPRASLLAPATPTAPAAGAGAGAGAALPRTILVCIDSETWNVLMPLLKAGLMPRLAEVMRHASYAEIHSDPPISTIAFDRISFGTAGTFGWLDWLADSIETLKEKGVDLIHAGNIAGTKNNIWRWLAEHGQSTLYISWAEQIFYGPGGKETIENLDPAVKTIRVGGLPVPSREEKMYTVLDHQDVPAPVKPTYSDTVAEDLIDSGLKRFDEAMTLLHKYNPQITFVHFGFIDTSYHLFWDAMDPDLSYLQKGFKAQRRYRLVIANLHRMMDLYIGELAREIWSKGGNIIVFSDHGATGGFASTWLGHDPIGEIIAAGPSFKPGFVGNPRPDIFDVVPTILAAYGLPENPNYHGNPLASVIGPKGSAAGRPVVAAGVGAAAVAGHAGNGTGGGGQAGPAAHGGAVAGAGVPAPPLHPSKFPIAPAHEDATAHP